MNDDFYQIQKDTTAEKYFNPLTKGITRKFIDNILAEIKNLGINSLLDIGCGTGYITQKLKDYVPTCIGCDIDTNRVILAKKYINCDISLVVADAVNLPFKNSYFDVVTAIEILEHISNIEVFLEELKRVSNDYILITVPNEPLFRLANLSRGKNLKHFGNPEGHIHHFNKNTFGSLLSEYYSEVKINVNSVFWLMAVCRV